ncbi:MAG: transporter substrate-binding domain-containing protein [Gammaproteobacteria bacterium]
MTRLFSSVTSIATLGALVLVSSTALADKLVVAADVGFAPHVMAKPGGGFEGYNVDMVNEIGRRLGMEVEIVDQEWSGIFAGLNAKKYDFIMAPTTVTAERAQSMLFMEGYLDTDYRFLVKKDASDLASLEDLEGKIIAVNKGNIYDKWASDRAEQYGWEMQRYGKNADAIQAVITGRAHANLAGANSVGWAAKKNPLLKTTLTVKTDQVFSAAFRKDDVELRNKIETAVECMKLAGFFAMLDEKWLGLESAPRAASTTVVMGFGDPSVEGYDPTPHTLSCN